MNGGITVAVIGLGPLGLVTLKNLLEEGFEVTGFDRNIYVGGLWQYTEDDKTSVMQSTITNISKERACTEHSVTMTRYRNAKEIEDVPTHPTAAHVEKYLVDYVHQFNLTSRMRLNTTVQKISFDVDLEKWAIAIQNHKTEYFDKVVVATGVNNVPSIPVIRRIENFEGQCIHSRAFKRPSDFKGKKVMVIGFANTAADTATQLVGHASKIYLSHRRGNCIIPRVVNGRASDHSLTYRLSVIQDVMWRYLPGTAESMLNKIVKKLQDKCFTLRPEWGFQPAPSLKQTILIVSDDLISHLENGSIKSVPGVKRITQGKQIELENGDTVEVDTIIFCTGYKPDFSILEPEYDPTASTTKEWSESKGSNGKPLPRLYQNIFSLERPESLAFMGCVAFTFPAFQIYDMATMALAQIWKGNTTLPSKSEMVKAVDHHHAWVCELAKSGSVYPGIVKPGPWMHWANVTAGTGIDENLGYGLKGWWFWLSDWKFCNLLMGGIYSPHMLRLFDGQRKKWDGARDAIIKANETASGSVNKVKHA
ncbi:hypothetical protein N0V90_011331 [Kalmusia sp. IMI 367209]|nr:hypothetical protein N0V90_011331 [Kalmusia sp. IMI 367209]